MSSIICPCNDLAESEISAVITEGARSLDDIFERLDCPIYCGTCLVDIDDILFASPNWRAAG